MGLYRTYYFPGDGTKARFLPEEQPDQLENGEAVLRIFAAGAEIVAEDLGVVPDFVRESLAELGIPGYRVQRWEKNWKEGGDAFLDPVGWPALSLATTGTHDAESVAEWYEALSVDERTQLLALPQLASLRERAPTAFDLEVRDALLETIYGAGSDLGAPPLPGPHGYA